MPDLKQTLGIKYLKETKFHRHNLPTRQRPNIAPPAAFKHYNNTEHIPLPSLPTLEDDFWKLLQHRRSQRKFDSAPLALETLAALLWASQGITARAGNYFFRTAPSGGALYPIETYLAIEKVQDINAGLYHFDVASFSLVRLLDNSIIHIVSHAALDQPFINDSAVTFIWTTVNRRNMCKYGDRGIRYICMDAGHICQNLLLAAEAFSMAACPVAAFYDDELNELLEIDGEEESVLYLAAVGCSKDTKQEAT